MNFKSASFHYGSVESTALSIAKAVSKATEETIMQQLNEFVSRGLIVVEEMPHQFIREPGSDTLTFRTQARLHLKDKEYIESLEAKIKELTDSNTKLLEQIVAERKRI